MNPKLGKKLRFLEIYCGILTLIVTGLLVSGFVYQDKAKFKEIDVGRINVVENDGRVKMVISNQAQGPDPVVKGKTYPFRHGNGTNNAGIIFYNNDNSECGGLIFDGNDKNGKPSAFSSLTFDQFNQDQAMGLQYSEGGGHRAAGLSMWDRPDKSVEELMQDAIRARELKDGPEKTALLNKIQQAAKNGDYGALRVYIGKSDPDKTAQIILLDPHGKPRLKLSVDGAGNPSLDFMDADGRVVYSLPEKKGS